MSQDKQCAIEAAARAYRNADPLPTMGDERRAMRAAILAYLSALVEDEGAVEACARAVWDDREPETRVWEEKHEIFKDEWRRTARAVLRTLLTRAQGESS